MAKLITFTQLMFLTFTVGLMVYVSCIGIRNIFRYNRFKINYEVSAQALNTQLRLNSEYKQRLASMSHYSFWELEAKKQLGLINKNEILYQMLGEINE